MTIFVNGQEVGASGGGLPTATGANQVPISTGAGTTYVATDAAGTRTALGLGSLATASTVTASQISDSTAAGRTILTAADAAAQRTALGAVADWTTVTASSFSTRSGTRGTASFDSGTGRFTFTIDGVALAYYDGTTRSAARAYYAVPPTAREVVIVHRLYTRTSGSTQTSTAILGALRAGTDDTAAPGVDTAYIAVGGASQVFPALAIYNGGAPFYWGDFDGSGAFGAAATGGSAWAANNAENTQWAGVRWASGRLGWGVLTGTSSTPGPEALAWSWQSTTPRWAGPPGLVILAAIQNGGSPSAQTLVAEGTVYYR